MFWEENPVTASPPSLVGERGEAAKRAGGVPSRAGGQTENRHPCRRVGGSLADKPLFLTHNRASAEMTWLRRALCVTNIFPKTRSKQAALQSAGRNARKHKRNLREESDDARNCKVVQQLKGIWLYSTD